VYLDADHSGMSKFASADDTNYKKFNFELSTALERIKSRGKGVLGHPNQHLQQSDSPRRLQDSHLLISNVRDGSNPSALHYRVPHSIRLVEDNMFTGRTEILETIENRLLLGPQFVRQKRVYLCGPGGVGKTQIAIRHSRIHSQNYTSVFWIDAREELTTCQSLADVAQAILAATSQLFENVKGPNSAAAFLGLNGFTELRNDVPELTEKGCSVANTILDWFLKEGNTKWLLIYDNYDDPESFDLEKYIPKSAWGNVLVTTRRLDVAAYQQAGIQIPMMNTTDALDFFSKQIGLNRQWDATGELP
jgi:NB-ARC domain-containing protein